jgi:hypothetical protein
MTETLLNILIWGNLYAIGLLIAAWGVYEIATAWRGNR